MILALFVRICHSNRRYRVFDCPVYKGRQQLDFCSDRRSVMDNS